MSSTNLIHTLAKNLKTRVFSISLEDYYFSNYTDYFAEIHDFALQLAISEQLLGITCNEALQRHKAQDITRKYRLKYADMTYDDSNTLFYIRQVALRLMQHFQQHTTDQSRQLLIESTCVPDIYKGITVKANAFKLDVYAKTTLLCGFNVDYRHP